jgi:hypothetical protein
MSRPQTRWFLDGMASVLWWLAFVVLFCLWTRGCRVHVEMFVLSAFQLGRLFTLYVVTGRLTGTAGSIAMERRP